MQLLGGLLMEKVLLGRHSFVNSRPCWLRAVGISLLFALVLSGSALGQQMTITGTVTSTGGTPLPGVTVRVQGTDTRAFTDPGGRYRLSAPADAVLTFSFVGRQQVQAGVAGRTTVDVTMAQIPYLEEVVVTAYTTQRRADITGAVSSVNVESAQRQTGASVLQRLDAAVPGVTVAASGSPGSRSSIRVRGVSSFQNNEPLYVVDGTPVEDSFMNWLNPADITSIQVLKDASAASIYGSRAGNGVILIETTKRGLSGPPQVTFRARTGVASPVRGYDDFLITDALAYHEYLKISHENAGLTVPTSIYGDKNNPTVPAYIYPVNCPGATGCSAVTAWDAYGRPTAVNESAYSYPNSLIMPGSPGTNWWDAVFGSAPVADYNLDIAGGSADNAYRVSFNYFNQNGTAIYNNFRRGSVRANTSFNRGRLNFGENVVVGLERGYGGMPDPGGGTDAEAGIMGKNILMQPVIPVHDIGGNFAGPKGLNLNQSNPVAYAFEHRNDINRNVRVFGNVFAGLDPIPQVALKSSLGFNLGQASFSGFSPITPENAEPNTVNSINENTNQFTNWTWSNTATWNRRGSSSHNFALLLGQAAGGGTNRFITASMANLLNSALDSRFIQDALGDAASKNVTSTGGRYAELSFFGKADYNFADKYVASFTLRKDGSSRLGLTNRWGTFPAFGLGWRLSNEPFMANNKIFSDVMVRYGWGVTGNQNIPTGRIVSQFGGSRGDTYYDVAGTNEIQAGFRQTSLGNPDLKWEENRSTNVGTDLVLFGGMFNVVVDVYRRNTNNLLFNPATPGTAGIASPPIVNIGKMRNTGFDFSIGHVGAAWNATFNGSHYSNKIVSIDGVQDFFYGPVATRFGNQTINQIGSPIGSFYGRIADGYFSSAADALAHTTAGNCGPVSASNPSGTGVFCQEGAAMGRIKFRDINGDGKIDDTNDRTIIGNPHPSFTAGLDLGARRGNWDLSATLFGSFGNDIFENQKEFYVFGEFGTNVKADLVDNSWTPTNQDAKYPRLDIGDKYSYVISSYYIEDGSYVRLRNVQLGYNVASALSRWLSATRVYVQADNLFTFTGYEGLDPALPAAQIFGSAGDIRDQYLGVDRGAYPSNRIFSIGLVTSF